jgi:LCP family protein required for cell wall assembly
VDLAELVTPNEVSPTPQGVNWGSLIWPGGGPTGDAQVLADRAAAAAAIADRAARTGDVGGDWALEHDVERDSDRHPDRDSDTEVSPSNGSTTSVEADPAPGRLGGAPDEATGGHWKDLSSAVRQRPLIVRTEVDDAPSTETELEPWNPEATYESLVRLLTELKALHPQEVAVLPRGPARRRFRFPGRLVAAVAVVALAVTGVGALVATRHHSPRAAAAVTAPRMSTVLVTFTAGNTVDGATLLGNDKARTEELLVPSGLIVDVPGQGSTSLSDALLSGPTAPAAAIENALQVRIDGTWQLDPASLAALVDAEGGVDVTLTSDVLPADGSSDLNLGAGTTHINGAQADQLAVRLGDQEPEVSRLARQQILLEAILAKLPSAPSAVTALLQNANVSGGVTVASLSSVLADIRDDIASSQAASTVVPTNEIDSGSGPAAYGLDETAAATMVAQRLAGASLPVPPGGRAHVLVQNGVGTPGLGEAARAVLVSRGYIFRTGGNATRFTDGPSVVLIPDATPQSRALGTRMTQLLGLPATAVQLDGNPTTIADVIVILGSDYQPKAPTTP